MTALQCHRCHSVWMPGAEPTPYSANCPSCRQWNLVKRAEERYLGTLNRATPAELAHNTKERKDPMKEETLKELLVKLGMTPPALAKVAGINVFTVRGWFSGKVPRVSKKTAERLKENNINIPAHLISRLGGPRKWSRRAKTHLRRSRAMKRAWEAKKVISHTNGGAGYIILRITKDTPEIIAINTKTRRMIPADWITL